MFPELPSRPPLLALPAGVCAVGFAVDDHEAIVSTLAELNPPGMPAQAVLKRRAEFLAGRLAALHALRDLGLGGVGPGRNQDGSPSWPEQVVGSITHGAGRALCVVARSGDFRSLGIDAERLLSSDVKAEVHRRICTAQERQLMAASLPLSEDQQVSLAFSGKESLFKCLSPLVGKYMDFQAAQVVEASGQEQAGTVSGELILELTVDWSPSLLRGLRLSAGFSAGAQHVETLVTLRS